MGTSLIKKISKTYSVFIAILMIFPMQSYGVNVDKYTPNCRAEKEEQKLLSERLLKK